MSAANQRGAEAQGGCPYCGGQRIDNGHKAYEYHHSAECSDPQVSLMRDIATSLGPVRRFGERRSDGGL